MKNVITVVERNRLRFEAIKYTGDNKKEVLEFMNGEPYYCDETESYFKFIEKGSYVYFNEEHKRETLSEDDFFNKMFVELKEQ